MLAVLRFLYVLGLAVWVGEIVFFSFVTAPALFGVLGAERAGPVLAVIFPRYYTIGFAAASIALGAAVLLARRGRGGAWWAGVQVALAVGLAATVWAGAVVHPRAQRLRLAAESARRAPGDDPAFQSAHRSAVGLNALALLAGLGAIAASAVALGE